jgi:hypothetical protein
MTLYGVTVLRELLVRVGCYSSWEYDSGMQFKDWIAKVCVKGGFNVSDAVLLGNTAAHCKQNTIRMAMLRATWRLLQGTYMRVRKHAYTERGQKCAKAYIKRYTTQVTKLARQCSYIMIAWYICSG